MIQAVQGNTVPFINTQSKLQEVGGMGEQTFVDALDAAKTLLQATNKSEQAANQQGYEFMTGKNEDIHSLVIAQEKSSILLQFTMQVRNQVLESYREIMRIPV